MLDAKPAAFQEPCSLIGSWRRFGSAGPVYEIVGVTEPKAADRPQMRIRVLETGEELDYPLTDLLEDPAEG